MKILKNTSLILTLIILLAACLRLSLLDKYPSAVTGDEAGQAYSAYSILKTGKDEWGDFLPLNPRGFGDYKPPVMMYLLVPSIAIFGLNEYGVRIPSAIAGILTVLVAYFLVKELFRNKSLALLSALFLAISPWHIYYSRLGWESNIGLLFFILGVWLFLKSIDRTKLLWLSVLSFGLAAMSYHSFKLLAPLMVLALIIIFRREIKKLSWKSFVPAISVAAVFILILGYGLIFSGASRRAEDQSILKEENITELRKNQIDDKLPQPLNRIIYNKYQFLTTKIVDNYIGYYSLSFLFGPHRSDGSILNFPSLGLLYIWQLPLILIGVLYLLKNKSKSSAVLLAWLLLAPIPASLTQDYMHAGRAQSLFPALTIISSIGLYSLFDYFKSPKAIKTFALILGLIFIISLFWRIDNYFFHTFNKPLGGLGQGYKEIINYTENNKDKYNKIIFTKDNSEPHAFLAFYSKSDPSQIQSSAQSWKKFENEGLRFLDMTDYNFGKYEFKGVDWSRDMHEKNALLVGVPNNFPPDITPKLEVKNGTGKTIFVVIDTNEIPE